MSGSGGDSFRSGLGYQCGPGTATKQNRSESFPTVAVEETEGPQLLPVPGRAGRGPDPGEKT